MLIFIEPLVLREALTTLYASVIYKAPEVDNAGLDELVWIILTEPDAVNIREPEL